MNLINNIGFSRRDFIKACLGTGVALSGLATITGCATTETAKPSKIEVAPASVKAEPVVYPRLADKKVQAPEDGCFVGFNKLYLDTNSVHFQKSISTIRSFNTIEQIVEYNKKNPNIQFTAEIEKGLDNVLDSYQKAFERNPSICAIIYTPKLSKDFPESEANVVSKKGITPYINAWTFYGAKESLRLSIKDIATGKHDSYLKQFAKGAVQYGEKHGGFFMTTMEESNADWYYWGQKSNFIPAWRRIWQIFEDQGANQYATWVWEVYCPEGAGTRAKHPDITYPGDKYVDWIGLSAFSRKQYHSGKTLGALAGQTYEQMRKNHPDKPIMQAEFAVTNDRAQPRWLMDAYKTIKTMPGMKAAIFYDNITPHEGDDHTLSQKSLQTLKEIFKDPYWIMAK